MDKGPIVGIASTMGFCTLLFLSSLYWFIIGQKVISIKEKRVFQPCSIPAISFAKICVYLCGSISGLVLFLFVGGQIVLSELMSVLGTSVIICIMTVFLVYFIWICTRAKSLEALMKGPSKNIELSNAIKTINDQSMLANKPCIYKEGCDCDCCIQYSQF